VGRAAVNPLAALGVAGAPWRVTATRPGLGAPATGVNASSSARRCVRSRPSELAVEIGIAPGQVSVLLAKARAEKLIVKKGAGYALKG
jgi:hypothetical protein